MSAQADAVMDYIQSRCLIVNIDERSDITWESAFVLCREINALRRAQQKPPRIFEVCTERVADQDRYTIRDVEAEVYHPEFYLSQMAAVAAIKELCAAENLDG